MGTGCEPRRTIEKLIEKQEEIVKHIQAKKKMCESLFLNRNKDDALTDKRHMMFKCLRSEIIAHEDDAVDSIKKAIQEEVGYVNAMYEIWFMEK